jgi:hypothetical protein
LCKNILKTINGNKVAEVIDFAKAKAAILANRAQQVVGSFAQLAQAA